MAKWSKIVFHFFKRPYTRRSILLIFWQRCCGLGANMVFSISFRRYITFFFFFIFRVKLTKKLIVSTEIENFVGTPVGNGFFRKLRKMLCCGTGEQLAGRSMRTERIPGTGYSYTIPPLPRYRSAMTSVPGFISSLLAISGSKNVSYTAYIWYCGDRLRARRTPTVRRHGPP